VDQEGFHVQAFASAVPGEHARLVRLCTRLTGDADAAADLAQETFIEAWRNLHKLHDEDGLRPWLSAIARHVCRRWQRQRGRELARIADFGEHASDPRADEAAVDSFDTAYELEREELADLLDRAFALLPAETRAALVEKYILDRPQAEIAARLGMSEGTVSMRLQRGKLALRRVLLGDLRDEAAAYGLVEEPNAARPTRIWCPFCGRQRLVASIDRTSGVASFDCPTCSADPDVHVAYTCRADVWEPVRGFKAILNRQFAAAHETVSQALRQGTAPCVGCGQPAPVEVLAPAPGEWAAPLRPGIHVRCASCRPAAIAVPTVDRYGLVLTLPETRRFWRAQRRMYALPERSITYNGQPAVLTRFESLTQSAVLEVVTARQTYVLLAVDSPTAA
jgi:RNA polymerase sigma-70 factor (ECF subfamily)